MFDDTLTRSSGGALAHPVRDPVQWWCSVTRAVTRMQPPARPGS